jgi:hypothetical protein
MAWVALAAIVAIMFWHNSILMINVVILYSWLILGLLLLRTVFVYIIIAVKTVGPIRKMGILMGIGFIFLLLGTMATSWFPNSIIPGEIIGHSIVIVGIILILNGIRQMQ